MKTVLILGANGRFGQAATQAFAQAGWRVLAQMRRASVAPLPTGATALALPLADSAALCAQAGTVHAVVHAVNPVYTRWDAEAMPALQQGMAAARALGALFMLPGNVYNFGETMPPLLTEDTPQRASNDSGRMRVAMEDALRDRSAQDSAQDSAQVSTRGSTQGLRSVVIRAGDFYGCGSGSWLDQAIVKSIRQGKLVYPGPLDLPHAWAYLPDLARAFVAVAAMPPQRAFETLHFAGHTLTGSELLAALQAAAETLGLRPSRGWRTGGMPWGLIRAVGLVHPPWRELARMSYLWRVPHALSDDALARAVGPLQATPLQQALRASLLDLGSGSTTPVRPAALSSRREPARR